jgi:single-stranded-DNA-specific exonuclease
LLQHPKAWHLLAHDRGSIERLGKSLRVSPIVAQLLLNRGLGELGRAKRFLDAPFKALHEPALLPGVNEAAERLYTAISSGRSICVYGDYDVDGLTGTVILWQALQLLGAQATYYVPHRLEEGYGLNTEALRQIAASGVSIVVTVDCGIGSVAEAEEAKRLGLELIVTDHHEPRERLPDATVLVHPRLPWSTYPFGGLSGSGVAFKLAWALCQRASVGIPAMAGAPTGVKVTPRLREFLLDSVTLAALGMVADFVPLQDENRIFVRHGLRRLAQTPSPGLAALLESAGLGSKASLQASDISYALGPRINAAGRLGCARLVVDLLTTTSRSRATELARVLENQNQDRQQIERRILTEARDMLGAWDLDHSPVVVLASRDWHPGVIGIVAGRLVESCARPVLLVALRDEPAASLGSGRSVDGFPLHEALQACGERLISHGGHAAAAGFKIPQSYLEDFRERVRIYSKEKFQGPPCPRLTIDAEVPLELLTPGFVESLNRLEPYGAGNPRPLFLAGPVNVVGEPRGVGRGEKHLRFRVQQNGRTFPVIGFNLAERVGELMSAGGQCCMVFSPSFNDWQNWRSLQLEVVDFEPGPKARLG